MPSKLPILFVAIFAIILTCMPYYAMAGDCKYKAGGKTFDLSPLRGQVINGKYADTTETFSLTFCDDLPQSVCPDGGALCTSGSKVSWGSNVSSPLPTANAPSEGQDFDFSLNYSNTDCSGTDKRKMAIRFFCSKDQDKSFLVDHNGARCDYYLDFHTPHACGSGGLSGGAIFLIVFFSLFAAYFIIGALLLKFLWKKEGLDIIPNRFFWAALPGFFIAGVSVAIAKIKACTNKGGANSSSSDEYQSYGGVDDV